MEQRPGKDYAWVELRLPGTELRGEVVDEKGKKVEGAVISARSMTTEAIDESFVISDAEGAFSLRGLHEGQARVSAEGIEGQSDDVVVSLVEGGEPPSLLLRLRKFETIQGQVISSSGDLLQILRTTYRFPAPILRTTYRFPAPKRASSLTERGSPP